MQNLADFLNMSLNPKCVKMALSFNLQQKCRMVKSSAARPRPTKTCFLLRGSPHLHFKSDVLVKFKPLRKRKGLPNPSILPTFNPDRKPYTAAFRLPSAEPDDEPALAQYHQARVVEAQHDITEILYPKPRSKHRYCAVCKAYYEDYKEHVETEQHLEYIRNSPYQYMILQAAAQLQEKREREQRESRESREAKGGEEDEKTVESVSEEAIFKCLNSDCSVSELDSMPKQEEALISC